jgi:hypothetical protein
MLMKKAFQLLKLDEKLILHCKGSNDLIYGDPIKDLINGDPIKDLINRDPMLTFF